MYSLKEKFIKMKIKFKLQGIQILLKFKLKKKKVYKLIKMK